MVSLAEPRLPLQIDDASRPETDEVSALHLFSFVQCLFKYLLCVLAIICTVLNGFSCIDFASSMGTTCSCVNNQIKNVFWVGYNLH